MITLRPYQERAVAELRAAYGEGFRSLLLVAPTGSGKTVIASYVIASAIAKGNRVLFTAPRRELIGQTVRKLADAGLNDVRVIQATNDTGRRDAPVVVGSIQTLILPRWSDSLPEAEFVIADEAHHLGAAQWGKIAAAYPAARWLGLTATPERADGKSLGDVFDRIVVASSVKELMELHDADPTQGLVRCRVLCPVSGELEAGELALDPVTAYQRHGDGGLAVVFCSTVEHARRACDEFGAAGISADVVTGTMAWGQRERILRSWGDGSPRVVCNCGVLTEGFDLPALSVCILARGFGHPGLYLQCVGRALRPWPGKSMATIIDLRGSALSHGPPDMDREYSLQGKAISGSHRDPIRQCPTCGAVFLASQSCPMCCVAMPVRLTSLPISTNVGVIDIAELKQPPKPMPLRSIIARHGDRCRRCAGQIIPGQSIWWSKGQQPWHVTCATAGETHRPGSLDP